MKERKTYIIYFHHSEIDNSVFYVGQSKGTKRAYDTKQRNFLWKRKYNQHGCRVEIKHRLLTKDEADRLEVLYIKNFGRVNNNTGVLTNLTNGADGSNGAVVSDKTRKKMSESTKGVLNPMFGKTHTPEARRKISLTHKGKEKPKEMVESLKKKLIGRKKSPEEIEKIRNSKIGIPRPEELKRRLSDMKSKAFAISDDFCYMEFKSVTLACEYMGCSRKEVSKAFKSNKKKYKQFNLFYL